jgi:flagellar hook assembly protein FlgD
MEKDVAVFRPQDVLLLGRVGGTQWAGENGFAVNNSQPGTRIFYWLKSAPKGTVTITITDAAGVETMELRGVTNNAGLNVVTWNGRLNRLPVAGDYRVVLKVGDKEYTSSVKVVEAYLNK